jgi:hypothetical protein
VTDRSPDDWAVTLVAYANDTLDAGARADVDAALASSADLRRELDEIQALRRALRRDDAPPTIPTAVWDRIDSPDPEPAPWPPPAAPPSVADVVPLRSRRRRHLAVALTAAAAVAALVVAGAVVLSGRDQGTDGQFSAPTPTTTGPAAAGPPGAGPTSALDAPAPQALMSTQVAMTSTRTATLDVSGTGVARFDGTLFGEDGTAEVGLALRGDGAVDFGDGSPGSSAYRLTIGMKAVSGPEAARPNDFEQTTIVVDGKQYDSEDGGPFTEEDASRDPSNQGLFAQLAVDPDVLARLPELAAGEIEDLGVERLDDLDVRHLRFDLKPSDGDDPHMHQVAEVWIDGTGVVHKLRLTFSGPLELDFIDDGEMSISIDIDLRDFGAPVEISAPS